MPKISARSALRGFGTSRNLWFAYSHLTYEGYLEMVVSGSRAGSFAAEAPRSLADAFALYGALGAEAWVARRPLGFAEVGPHYVEAAGLGCHGAVAWLAGRRVAGRPYLPPRHMHADIVSAAARAGCARTLDALRDAGVFDPKIVYAHALAGGDPALRRWVRGCLPDPELERKVLSCVEARGDFILGILRGGGAPPPGGQV